MRPKNFPDEHSCETRDFMLHSRDSGDVTETAGRRQCSIRDAILGRDTETRHVTPDGRSERCRFDICGIPLLLSVSGDREWPAAIRTPSSLAIYMHMYCGKVIGVHFPYTVAGDHIIVYTLMFVSVVGKTWC